MTQISRLPRRSVLKGAAALAGLAAARPLLAQGMTPITTAFGWISNVEYAGWWVANEKGYFADENIDFDYLPGGPNAPQTLVTLASGAAQVAVANWLPILDARAQDNDFVILGANWNKSPASLMSMAAKPIKTPEDLVGAKILAQKPEDSVMIDSILSAAGLPLDYEILPTGFSPEPLLAGDGEAYFAFATNQPITFENMGMVEGEDFHVTLMSDLGYDVKQGLIVADKAFVDANREAMVAYLRALIRGWTFALENPTYGPEIVLAKYGADLGLDPAQQARQMELQIPLMSAPEGGKLMMFDPSVVEGTMTDAAKAAGREVPPVADFVDMSLLEDAHASL